MPSSVVTIYDPNRQVTPEGVLFLASIKIPRLAHLQQPHARSPQPLPPRSKMVNRYARNLTDQLYPGDQTFAPFANSPMLRVPSPQHFHLNSSLREQPAIGRKENLACRPKSGREVVANGQTCFGQGHPPHPSYQLLDSSNWQGLCQALSLLYERMFAL